MWFILATISMFMSSLVNYIDEYLTNNNKLPEKTDIHTKIGGLVLISTLMSFAGASLMMLIPHDPTITSQAKFLSLLSAVPMVGMYISYFWLLIAYPVHLVVPLFQISSIWLLIFELISGDTITMTGLAGMVILMYGAYVLDVGTFKWKVPTKLLLICIPATSTYALQLFFVKIASATTSSIAISYWQMFGIGIIGVLLLVLIKKYRDGFLYRIKNQGKNFLGLSLLNESLAEGGFLLGNMAVAIAPLATYVSALTAINSVFLLIIFWLFPLGARTKVTTVQWIAVVLISVGVYLIGEA